MKKHTLLKISCILGIMAIIILSCNKDDEIIKPSSSVNTKAKHRLLKGDDLQNALKVYEEQMTQIRSKNNGFNTKNGEIFTIDQTEVLENTDRTGKIHYTYRVNHPLSSESIFFNLVISDNDGYKKTRLIKYEMTTEFADRFNNGGSDFINMDGTITFSLLSADEGNPCGETPINGIPIQGGSGPGGTGGYTGGSSGGGGEPWNPNGNGNPHNQVLVEAQYLSMSLSYFSSQGSTGEDGEDEMEPGGTDDEGWYLVSRSPRSFNVPPLDDTLNPCGEEEEVGVLLPFKIIIDQTFEDNDCLNSVYNQLGGSPTFQEYLNNFDDDFSVAHLKLSAASTSNHAITNIPSNYTIEIVFSTNVLSQVPPLDVAGTMIHELLHAEIYRKLLMVAGTGSLYNGWSSEQWQNYLENLKNDFPGLYDYYLRYESNVAIDGELSDAQHQMMAQHYRDIIIQVLKEFDNTQSEDVYEAIAWVGLMGEGTFNAQTGLPQNPTVAWQNIPQAERLQILATYNNYKNSNPSCSN
ncbi:hypothetical protein FUA48_11485 [Flavobacterium alkalisoli]|uniref:Uncharacterized protein n=1 Tax=Flavobacterium alkalisoli TaxID=2602769 RepID=A0A5B9FZH7_9FLAO|nr:hypothetical protein [Flavobacterium alkalisoli]QEE50177.1 hypothetical protein FUA48_11485 [Flavobacterium alkalisoli]